MHLNTQMTLSDIVMTLRYTNKQTHSLRQRLGGWSSWCTFLTFPGFLGEFCDLPVNRCDSSPCYNGGTCTIDSSGNPVCSCPTGEWPSHRFQHSRHKKFSLYQQHILQTQNMAALQTGSLSLSLCLAVADWIDTQTEREQIYYWWREDRIIRWWQELKSSHSESCLPSGSSGSRCEVIAKTCQSDTCQNGGACRNDLNSFTCLCPLGFSGNRSVNLSHWPSAPPYFSHRLVHRRVFVYWGGSGYTGGLCVRGVWRGRCVWVCVHGMYNRDMVSLCVGGRI